MADNFADKIVLSGLGPSSTGSNIGATAEVGEPSQSYTINSAWWSWTAPNDGTFTINTKTSNFDTFLSVFTGSAVSTLSLIDYNDDANFAGGDYSSLLSLNAKAGTTYQIAVDGYGNSTGNIQLNIVPVIINGTPNSDSLSTTAYPETINGLAGNDNIYGGAGNDIVNGNDGDDILDGGPGIDQVRGGLGNDIYDVDNTGDIVTELPNQGIDEVYSRVTYTLPADVENLYLEQSSTESLNGTGNDLPNLIRGGQFANVLNGGSGADSLYGGQGDDTYEVDNPGDIVGELPNNGIDVVNSSITYTLPADVEKLTLTGTAAINGTGNNVGNNVIVGNSANNTLNGGGGYDILTGNAGADTFLFKFGDSSVSVSTRDTITDFAIGTDKIDLLTQGGAATNAPVSFSRAANDTTSNYLGDLADKVFIDANGELAGNQPLGINSAALVGGSSGSNYLVINDGTAGFQAGNDLVIELVTSNPLPPLGNIPVTNFFV
jgi:Ca2+-binding RTX toxin-like protein